MPLAHDGMQMDRRAQRVSEASGSRADDAQTSSLRWQAPTRREPDAQGLDAGCLDETPVQTGDAKMVEACCKLAVQAATRTAEGGRSHRDGQRSDLAASDSLRSELAVRRCAAGGREPTDRQPRRTSIAFSEDVALLTFVVRVMEIISQ